MTDREIPDIHKTIIRELQAHYLSDLDSSNGEQEVFSQYLVENQTPKGLHRSLILDDFVGHTLEELKGVIRDLYRIAPADYPFDILAYDPILESFIPVGDQLSGLARCAVLRLVPPPPSPSVVKQ